MGKRWKHLRSCLICGLSPLLSSPLLSSPLLSSPLLSSPLLSSPLLSSPFHSTTTLLPLSVDMATVKEVRTGFWAAFTIKVCCWSYIITRGKSCTVCADACVCTSFQIIMPECWCERSLAQTRFYTYVWHWIPPENLELHRCVLCLYAHAYVSTSVGVRICICFLCVWLLRNLWCVWHSKNVWAHNFYLVTFLKNWLCCLL